MRDLFTEAMDNAHEALKLMEDEHIRYINEHWDELDEMTKVTFQAVYEDRVPKSR